MNISHTIIEHGEALKNHTWKSLVERSTRNVNTENMPNWDLIWKGYHYVVNINNLREKYND